MKFSPLVSYQWYRIASLKSKLNTDHYMEKGNNIPNSVCVVSTSKLPSHTPTPMCCDNMGYLKPNSVCVVSTSTLPSHTPTPMCCDNTVLFAQHIICLVSHFISVQRQLFFSMLFIKHMTSEQLSSKPVAS